MKIRIRNGFQFVKYYDDEVEGETSQPFTNFIQNVTEKFKLQKNRSLRYTIVSGDTFTKINDHSKTLNDYNFKQTDSILIENESGWEIESYLITLISYIGPPIVFAVYLIQSSNLDYIKILSTFLIYAHFLRRIYESTYIFRHGKEKMSINDMLGVAFYYWILNGVLIGYSIFNSDYHGKNTLGEYLKIALYTILFFYAEYGNCKSHIYLSELKARNNGHRAVPHGGMFEYVSCAHYFWELLSWAAFALISNVLNGYLFVLYSLVSMGMLALDRHRNLKRYFKEDYPSNRKAIIPFIL